MSSPNRKKSDRGQNIQVFVRVRPLNGIEKMARSCAILDTPGCREVVVKEKSPSSLTKTFNFDRVFGPTSAQSEVYQHVVGPLIKQVLKGYNCTVFAYGQTGTGKTYTMEGLRSSESDPDSGIIPRALGALFDGLKTGSATEWGVRVSFLELYNEEIFDLLSGNDDQSKLRLYEDVLKKGSVIIQGLEEVQVRDKCEVFKILEKGSIKRQTAETKMNANSSRSHTVFTVTVFVNQRSIDGEDMLKIGKLNLVDLAGSENIGRSGAVDKRAREAGNINQSLLTLGRVITCLVDRTPHIPYRESKLTRLLQDSLGGRTKTSIIATVSPAAINLEETLSTLDYAHRAKNITNKPEVNQSISKREKLLEYHREIDHLKAELQAARDKDGVFLPKDTYEEQMKERDRQEEEVKNLTKDLKAKEVELERFVALFEETAVKLETVTEDRDKAKRALDCTRTVLHKTENDKREQAFLVQKHVETECKLSQQAHLLLAVSDEATKDLDKVQDKVDRLEDLERSNRATAENFRNEFADGRKKVESLVESHVDVHAEFCSGLRSRAAERLERRHDDRSTLSTTYADNVAKLVETMGEIERVASDDARQEQTWIDQLLKRTRNDADEQASKFHAYLVEQLLSAANVILAAVANQDKNLKELSAKLDVRMDDANENLIAYLEGQKDMRVKAGRDEAAFRSGIAAKADALADVMEAERKSAEDFRKRSMAFRQQMAALFDAHRSEEEKYLTAANGSLTSSVNLVNEAKAEVDESKVKSMRISEEMDGLEKDFRTGHETRVERLVRDKVEAIERLEEDRMAVVRGVDKVKAEAESFVTAGKDAWNDHRDRTESELRKKSDDASRRVETLRTKTSDARVLTLDSGSAMDALLESQRRDDERTAFDDQTQLSARCRETSEFGSAFADRFQAVALSLDNYLDRDLKRDVATGTTPMRKSLTFPKRVVHGTPDDDRLKRYRAKRGDAAFQTPSKLDLDNIKEDNDDADSMYSTSTVLSDADDKSSNCSGSTQFSRHNSAESLQQQKQLHHQKKSTFKLPPPIEDEDTDKENFARPAATKSKIKQPENYRSRSGSRTRTTTTTTTTNN